MRKREQEANKFVCVSFRLLSIFFLFFFRFDANEDEPAIWIKDAEYALHCIEREKIDQNKCILWGKWRRTFALGETHCEIITTARRFHYAWNCKCLLQ